MATKPPAPEYGCDPSYLGPPVRELIRNDVHGYYIREAFDLLTGRFKTDETGAVIFDGCNLPCRRHVDHARKGFRLLRVAE